MVRNGDDQPKPGWTDDTSETFERAAEALRAAWDATAESRAGALESTLSAVDDLTTAVERGVAAALERWRESEAPPAQGDPDPDPEP